MLRCLLWIPFFHLSLSQVDQHRKDTRVAVSHAEGEDSVCVCMCVFVCLCVCVC
jgi:hypothetical protein